MVALLPYWPVLLGCIALVAWGVRLEAKVLNATPKEDHAKTVQKLDDVKDTIDRMDRKLDRLLERQ